MNKLSHEQRCAVIRCLVEGNSIRSTVRITGVAKNTIQKLTREVGEACRDFQDKNLRNVRSRRIQCDEIWNFCYAKDKNVPDSMRGDPGVGSMWTFVGLDAETKQIVSWQLGARDAANAQMFCRDIAERLANRVQLTTDGARIYLEAIEDSFGADIDFSQLIKAYHEDRSKEASYSPAKCLGTKKRKIVGSPDPEHVSTSFVERQNLNIRMQNRRYTRLTNAFSKKAEMLAYSISVAFMYHNLVRIHQTLRMTPALAAGVSNRVWSISDVVAMADEYTASQKENSN